MQEIWKEIDDRYSISNLGRVKSNYANKERILKPTKTRDGYLTVDLRHGENRKNMRVHRLVAIAFIENPHPDIYTEVNHKDEDKTNNCVDNLEWCTTEYNCNYGTRLERKAENCKKPICSVDIDGAVKHYSCRKEAAETTGIDGASISKALTERSKHNKTAGGFAWFYDDGTVEDRVRNGEIKVNRLLKCVMSVDEFGNVTKYPSIAEASRQTGITNISRAVKFNRTAGGRFWYYDL